MSGWALINFEDIETGGPEGSPVDVRFARKHLDSAELGVSRFRYPANAKFPFGHRHREQEEAYVVVSGGGRVKLDNEIIDIKVGDVVRVSPEVVRGFAAGPDGLEMICIGGHKPEGGDGELVQDFWP
ncbi:MAG: hypothetical protein QOF76_1028 [Solirubrobacteraceae bacterium]|nr:hypothetical protein [Solirubrobacteraceae bacterium]